MLSLNVESQRLVASRMTTLTAEMMGVVVVVSSAEAKKARSHNENYQLETSVKVSKSAAAQKSAQLDYSDSEDEEDTSGLGDKDSENQISLNPSFEDNISFYLINLNSVVYFSYLYIFQLRKVVQAVCSSSQHKKNWLNQVKSSLMTANDPNDKIKPLMLILDVKTHWSSSHQMLGMYLLFIYKYID